MKELKDIQQQLEFLNLQVAMQRPANPNSLGYKISNTIGKIIVIGFLAIMVLGHITK